MVGQELSEPKTPVEPAASVCGDMSPGISCSEEAGIPRFYQAVGVFNQGLTGICWADLKDAPCLKEALQQFFAWLPEEMVTAVAWSGTDESQLRREKECKNLSMEGFSARVGSWVDCQAMFAGKMRIKRCYSLQEALIASDILSEGRAHNGMVDAYNTALLFRKLLTEEEFRLNPYYEEAHRPGRGSTLQFSLGDLLKGLDLEPGLSA